MFHVYLNVYPRVTCAKIGIFLMGYHGDTIKNWVKKDNNYMTTGWWFQPLWKIWKSVGMIIPNIWKNEKCSKPTTIYDK